MVCTGPVTTGARRTTAYAPGRVNVIGDHTDYMGGFVMPMAIDLGTTVTVEHGGATISLRSATEDSPAVVPLGLADPSRTEPAWARFVAGVVAELRPDVGAHGTVATTLPVGAGLASSAALEVAVALALGFDGPPVELAQLCRQAEQRASGVPCGIMDQLASAAGVERSLLLIDCRELSVTSVLLPDGVAVVGVHSGQSRTLAGSAYADRRAECEAAELQIGPLRDAELADVARMHDPLLRRRARHVVTENGRVHAFAAALAAGDLAGAGRLMAQSHASLRDDFEVSTPALDGLAASLAALDGVFGARMTGGGFGGVVVALVREAAVGEVAAAVKGRQWWRFTPSGGATVTVTG